MPVRVLLACGLVLGLVGILTSNSIVFLLFLVLSWWIISKLFERSFFTSLFSGMVFGFTASTAAITAFSALFWILKNPLDLVQLGICTTLLLVITGLVVNRQFDLPFKHSNIISAQDIYALLVVLSFAALYVRGSYTVTGSFSPKIDAVQNTTKALDDQNHFAMFRDTVTNNRGLLLGNDTIYKPDTLLSVYPKGAHTAAAVLTESGRSLWANGNRSAPGSIDELYAYAFIKIFMFAVTVFVLSRFALEFIGKLANRLAATLASLLTVALCAYVTIIYLTPLFMDGAFSFIPIFLFAPIFILAYSDLALKRTSLSLMIILGLVASASMLMWTIAGLPYFMLLAIVGIRLILAKENIRFIGLAAAILGVSVLLGMVQIYVQLTSNVEVLSVNTAGGFFTFQLLLPLVFAAFILWSGSRITDNWGNLRVIYQTSLVFIAIFAAICAVISYLNFKETGEVQYYFTKLLYAPFIIMAFLAAGMAVKSLLMSNSLTSEKYKKTPLLGVADEWVAKLAVFVLGISFLFIAFPPNLAIIDYLMKGQRNISTHTAGLLITELGTITKNRTEASFILSDKVPHFENVMATHTLNASNLGNDCQGLMFDAIYKQEKIIEVFTEDNINRCIGYGTTKIQITTDSDVFDELPARFSDKINIKIVKV